MAALVWGLALPFWISLGLFYSDEPDWFVVSSGLAFSRQSWSWFSYLWPRTSAKWCLCSARKWWACVFQRKVGRWSFFSPPREKWVTILKCLAFHLQIIVMQSIRRQLWNCCTENHYAAFSSERAVFDIINPAVLCRDLEKSLAKRHGIYDSETVALCYSNGKDTI